ncbi:DUF6881 domain-containing protein [Nocardia uniformis]|uniref:DUF6881 domain-containing protein n=1 Tax=Nocardia uniformis TaxID=53432 RepID=UPI001BB24DC0|nr:hypothetical protein [Nocardia uniformis]
MKHWKIIWHHDFDTEPVIIFSEIANNGYEVRKVQQYRDGRLLRTDGSNENAEVGLSEIPVGGNRRRCCAARILGIRDIAGPVQRCMGQSRVDAMLRPTTPTVADSTDNNDVSFHCWLACPYDGIPTHQVIWFGEHWATCAAATTDMPAVAYEDQG